MLDLAPRSSAVSESSSRLVCARGVAWVLLPRENPSTLIFSQSRVDPMWDFAYASHMSRLKLQENRHKQALACLSGFWSLVALLFLNTVPVCAEWQAVEKDYLRPGLQTVYLDPESIRREGDLVTMWQLIDFTWMQGNPRGPTRFFSTKTRKQFDCAEKRLRLLAYTEFSHHMGIGIAINGYVNNDNWLPVEAGSISYALWEVVCGEE